MIALCVSRHHALKKRGYNEKFLSKIYENRCFRDKIFQGKIKIGQIIRTMN